MTPWTVARQVPLAMGVFWQEYWSGLPFPSPGDLPVLGINPASPVFPALHTDSLPSEPLRKPNYFFIGRGQRLLVTFHLKALIIACCVMVLFQIFCEMTFNVSAKSSLELRSIYLSLEVIDHSITMSFIFE